MILLTVQVWFSGLTPERFEAFIVKHIAFLMTGVEDSVIPPVFELNNVTPDSVPRVLGASRG